MTTVCVRIGDKEDRDKSLFPELEEAAKLIHGPLQFFGILESGMTSGATSVCFCAKAEDGTVIILETSAKNFLMMAACLQGAELRFLDKKAKKN